MSNNRTSLGSLSEQSDARELRRARRWAGINVWMACILAVVLSVLANVVSVRLHTKWSVSKHLPGGLSERTVNLLRNTTGEITLTAFFESRHPLMEPVKALLKEFSEAATDIPNLRIRTRIVDPNRDVALAAEVVRESAAEPNSIVIVSRDTQRVLENAELLSSDVGLNDEDAVTDFIGEQVVGSAIWNISRASHPAIYFATGNGEHDPTDHHPLTGYSNVARNLQRDGFRVQTLELSSDAAIPEDCSLLVLAGPRKAMSHRVLERIGTYLSTGGRMLLMVDRADDGDLRALLERWGVILQPPRSVTGGDEGLETSDLYGEHPVTVGLKRMKTAFRTPCLLSHPPSASEPAHADRPSVTLLVKAQGHGALPAAGTRDELEPPPSPPAYAVAVERGTGTQTGGTALTRIIIVGDAQFAANGMVGGGYGSNRDLFLASVDWLTEQEALIGRLPITFRVLRSGIPPGGWLATAALVAVAWPLAVWMIGFLLTSGRRAAQRV